MKLPPFDPSRATEGINYQRAHFQLPTSMVALVDSFPETIVQVYLGTHDQVTAADMDEVLVSAEFPHERLIPSTDSRFEKLCDLLSHLRMPLVCRKKETIWHAQGYLVDPAELYAVLAAAKEKKFVSISQHGKEKQYSTDNRFQGYNLIGLSLR